MYIEYQRLVILLNAFNQMRLHFILYKKEILPEMIEFLVSVESRKEKKKLFSREKKSNKWESN